MTLVEAKNTKERRKRAQLAEITEERASLIVSSCIRETCASEGARTSRFIGGLTKARPATRSG